MEQCTPGSGEATEEGDDGFDGFLARSQNYERFETPQSYSTLRCRKGLHKL